MMIQSLKRATIISIDRILLYHRCNQLRNIWYFRKFVHARFVIYQTIAAIYDWEMSNQPQMCFGKYCAVFNETKSIDIFYVRTVLFDIRRGIFSQFRMGWYQFLFALIRKLRTEYTYLH